MSETVPYVREAVCVNVEDAEAPGQHRPQRASEAPASEPQRAGEAFVHWPPVDDQSLNFAYLFPNRKHAERMLRAVRCQLRHLC